VSQQFVPPTVGRLVDGRELRIEGDGVHIDDRFHPLARIEEARLLFLRPETIGLRLASIGQVEYSFEKQGDGVAALEALFRLRPDLRRADAPAPVAEAPAGYFAPVAAQPLAPPPPATTVEARPAYPMAPTIPPVMPTAEPTPFPPQTMETYGADPNATHAEVTPVPRSAGQLIGSAFRLFSKRLAPLLTLALLVATLPSALTGLLDAIASALSGVNPLAGAPNPLPDFQQALNGQTATVATSAPTTTGSVALDAVVSVLSLAVVLLTLLIAAWSQAALSVGAREAALGRPISVRACAREGLARLWPTLWALVFLYFALGIIAIPGFALALAFALGPLAPGANVPAADAPVFFIIAAVIAAGTLAIVAYLWTRFALYPTAAALGLPQPLRLSLQLTSSGKWRVFWALLVVTVAVSLLLIPASLSQFFSVALSTLALAPLAQLIAGPLGALIRVLTLYDQRLRREGYLLFMREGIAPPTATPVNPAAERHTEVGG